MPRSLRHRSKKSVKEGKEYYYSDTEEDVAKGRRKEVKEGRKSGGKRKVEDVSGYSSEEYVGSKRRKERGEKVGSDRWNGLDLESEGMEEKEMKKDLRSRLSGGRRDGEGKEGSGEVFVGKEDSLSGKDELKRRVERDVSEKEKVDEDLSRKDDYKVKDANAKDKEKELERDYRAVDREELKARKGFESNDWTLEDEYGNNEAEKEVDRRRKKKSGDYDDKDMYHDRGRDSRDTSRRDRVKDGADRDERHKDTTVRDKHYWPLEESNGKHGSEKERDTRRSKKTGDSDDKDKYQESYKERSDINMTSVRERSKDRRDKDERLKGISSRDKNREYYDRDSRRDIEKREGTERGWSQKYDEYSDNRASKDHVGSKTDTKYTRDEFESLDSRQKKSKIDIGNFNSSTAHDDQRPRYKDYKETRGFMDKKEYDNLKSRDAKECHDSTNKYVGAKEETVTDKEISRSLHPDEFTAGQSQNKRSPSSTPLSTKDLYRHSKQSNIKYESSMPDDRFHSNSNYVKEGNSSGAYNIAHSSRALDKFAQKGEIGHAADMSSERHRNTDRRVSPVRLADKSQSPSSTERRHLNRIGDRRSRDYEDYGQRSSGFKNLNYHHHDGKRNQDRKVDATSGNSRSFLPPASPFKHGVDSSYAGSAEEDGRGKLNNHPKRVVDSSMRRMQGNSWWGTPNWPSPMGNGYLPFPHGPGTVSFHPMMQQFPPQMYDVRPPMDHSGVPFHIPDGDRFPGYGRPFGWPNHVDETCPSPMPNWESNNMRLGEGFTQGRTDWDQNKNLTANASREPSLDRNRGASSATMESPLGNRRANAEPADDSCAQLNSGGHQVDKPCNENQIGSKILSGISSPLKDISSRIFKANVPQDEKNIVNIDDHVRRSCVYLSMIDISPDLVPSDLFDQCVSLLKLEHSTLSHTKRSRFCLQEEAEGESTKMKTYISPRPVFTEVSELLYEKAMSIYRQHRDDTTVNYSSSQSIGHVHHTPEIQGFEPSSLAPTLLGDVNDQKLVCPGPPSEFTASSVNEYINSMPVIHPKLETHSPMLMDTSDVNVSNQPEAKINTFSTAEKDKEELMIENSAGDVTENKETLDKTNSDMDERMQIESPSIIITNSDAKAKLEASKPVIEEGDATTDEQPALKETIGDPTANMDFEECEDTMMTELNEYESVNLNRIH